MSGQSASLSLSEARAMQNRIQHSGSQAKSSGSGMKKNPMKKMPKMKSMSADCK